jgi:hypothetical protein
MKKILSFTLCFFLLAGMLTAISPLDPSVSPALAQSSDQRTPTATPASAEALPAADAAITFGQLGMTDTFLYGPYDTLVINYNVPSDWKLDKAATLQLTLTPSFTPGTAAASDKATPYSGASFTSASTAMIVSDRVVLDRRADLYLHASDCVISEYSPGWPAGDPFLLECRHRL